MHPLDPRSTFTPQNSISPKKTVSEIQPEIKRPFGLEIIFVPENIPELKPTPHPLEIRTPYRPENRLKK